MVFQLQTALSTGRQALRCWIDDKAPRMGAALAFYTALSLSPFLVIIFSLIALIYGDEAARGQLSYQIDGLIGTQGAEVVQEILRNSRKPETGFLALFSGITTLFLGASGVFGELQDAMNSIWRVKAKADQGILSLLKTRFFSFAMVMGVGFLLLVSLVISTVIAAAGEFAVTWFPGFTVIAEILNSVFTFAVITILFALIFKVLPDVVLSWSDVWFGSLLTAFLFTIGKILIGLYLGKSGVTSAFGAAGSLVAFLIWIYYATQILLFGAELIKVRVLKNKKDVQPKGMAEKAPLMRE